MLSRFLTCSSDSSELSHAFPIFEKVRRQRQLDQNAPPVPSTNFYGSSGLSTRLSSPLPGRVRVVSFVLQCNGLQNWTQKLVSTFLPLDPTSKKAFRPDLSLWPPCLLLPDQPLSSCHLNP
ncbi:hypothetical protein PGT21_021340 [Puccinia graminis f. sp. tritici]|uniref:Uncharacterized protein n=1 Tax=Puccinia graminis f. sp. tritici TaxID=56615 RepID=A0A5B0PH81_PUCGR|nr:hypothetical protein PGT21_021340 [Puccinia graminis f. sp. tritici]